MSIVGGESERTADGGKGVREVDVWRKERFSEVTWARRGRGGVAVRWEVWIALYEGSLLLSLTWRENVLISAEQISQMVVLVCLAEPAQPSSNRGHLVSLWKSDLSSPLRSGCIPCRPT